MGYTHITWRIVSKLKVSPFHRVNSPLEAPVINRRPSGVHYKVTLHNQISFYDHADHGIHGVVFP